MKYLKLFICIVLIVALFFSFRNIISEVVLFFNNSAVKAPSSTDDDKQDSDNGEEEKNDNKDNISDTDSGEDNTDNGSGKEEPPVTGGDSEEGGESEPGGTEESEETVSVSDLKEQVNFTCDCFWDFNGYIDHLTNALPTYLERMNYDSGKLDTGSRIYYYAYNISCKSCGAKCSDYVITGIAERV